MGRDSRGIRLAWRELAPAPSTAWGGCAGLGVGMGSQAPPPAPQLCLRPPPAPRPEARDAYHNPTPPPSLERTYGTKKKHAPYPHVGPTNGADKFLHHSCCPRLRKAQKLLRRAKLTFSESCLKKDPTLPATCAVVQVCSLLHHPMLMVVLICAFTPHTNSPSGGRAQSQAGCGVYHIASLAPPGRRACRTRASGRGARATACERPPTIHTGWTLLVCFTMSLHNAHESGLVVS